MNRTAIRCILVGLATLGVLATLLCVDCCRNAAPGNAADPDLTISPDISNQNVLAFAEDSTGHVWIGTFRGLNKYDGHEYHQYFCNNDSTGLPDNHITSLLCDSRGRLWVGTVNGVCLYTAADTFRRIEMETKNRLCQKIIETRDHRILLYNLTDVLEYDPEADRFVRRLAAIGRNKMLLGNVFTSRDRLLWVAEPQCLRSYDTGTWQRRDSIALDMFAFRFAQQDDDTLWLTAYGAVRRFSMSRRTFLPATPGIRKVEATDDDLVNAVRPFGPHQLLVSMEMGGLLLYDTASETLTAQDDTAFPFEPPMAGVNCMFTDSRGNLWIGTADKGVKIVSARHGLFVGTEYINRTIGQQSVPAVCTDGRRYLWIATMAKGLYVYDLTTHRTTSVGVPTLQAGSHNRIKCLHTDADGRLWIGTKNTVLRCRYDGGGRLALEKKWDVFMPMSIAADRDGAVWVSTSTCNAFVFRPGADEPERLQAYPNGFVFIPCVAPLADGSMLLAAFNQKLLRVNRHTLETSLLPVSDDDMKRCVRRSVLIPTSVCQDHMGDIWIGTICNGVMVYSPRTQQMKRVEGMSCSDITGMEEDREGNMWISTMNGLNRYNRKTGGVTHFFLRNGIACNQFYDHSSCRMDDGTIVFGGTHGVTAFNPSEKAEQQSVPLKLEYVKIHNDVVRPSRGGAIAQVLGAAPRVTIRHDQNSFSITYSALDYGDARPTHYQYRLEGFDCGWRDVGIEHTAYYANVPAGHYTFRVKTKEGTAEASIDVVVKPSPLRSWWAYTLYALMALGVAANVVRVRRRITAQKLATRKAEMEREQEQRVNKMNMSFFANVSHEFRTPLTVISGPVELLAQDKSLPEEAQRLVASVKRGVGRMLRLVNQLMDFNKLENDTLRLNVSKEDAVEQINQVCDFFLHNMQSKEITLLRRGIDDSMTAWLDADKLDKIMSNLLSNAMKFTPRGGRVEVTLDVVHEGGTRCMKLSVADTGPGIPEEHLENVFKKYFQVVDNNKETYNWGTGIGLYYARRLAELHHGSLTAANDSVTHGAVFTLLLPIEESAYQPSEKCAPAPEQHIAYPLPSPQQSRDDGTDKSADESRPTILVVDDDVEITDYLRTLLSPHYNVAVRYDAESALQAIAERQPQIVLSDIVMPNGSGYQLCRKIKDDIQLCHIPVILVTAKHTTESQVEGLNVGADAYVTKPFDPNVLLAQIGSLLKNHERIRSVLTHATAADEEVKEVLSKQDKTFMEELYRLMEDELANSELDILHITDMLHISRTKFYYKIKGLTGETPATFFRTYKLNRAAQMLQMGQYNISEVADLTGFSTQSHFANLFKKQFGMTPSEYRVK